ncbi:DUF4259 domain-containing protein [Nocardioides litoris]|uniref:DUF4259 domain-containing protein n=1 Tax=Nocardioides litoris TaxID=1926648 RepID=UPI0011205D14|nr:DUF4259 domain-containing protein [Nocardioides litoris]
MRIETWGTGPFENDEAAAWGDELDEATDPAAYAAATLQGSADPARVVAAAAWLAAGLPGAAEPADGPSTPPSTPDPALADDALAALGAVLADDGWAERWSDPADRETARAQVRSLVETWEVAIG